MFNLEIRKKTNTDLKSVIRVTSWCCNLSLISIHDKMGLFNEIISFDNTRSLWISKKIKKYD